MHMRARVLIGVMASCAAWWAPAAAQLSNSPPYPPYPLHSPHPLHQPWSNAAPTYIPAPRYPTDSRNLTLDNRAPTLRPTAPDLRDATPRVGSPLENDALGGGARRFEGLRAPGVIEPGRSSWR